MKPIRILRFATTALCGAALSLFAFTQTQTTGSIAGVVSNSATQTFLEGAVLDLPAVGRQTLTDANGRFQILNLPPGEYTIVASYIGLDSERRPVVVTAGQRTPVNFELGSTVYRMEEFRVTGEREGNALAIMAQRNADNVKNIVAMDSFGTLPNMSAGELAIRLPGVAGQLDNEGNVTGVIVRGMASTMNRVTVDGGLMSNVGGLNRQFQTHSLTGAMFEQLEVIKGHTPDKGADSLGGTINLKTRSPLAMKEKRRVNYSISGRWAPPFTEQIPLRAGHRLHPLVNLAYQEVFDVLGDRRNLGVAVNAFYSENVAAYFLTIRDFQNVTTQPAVVRAEFLNDRAPYPSCHASTIVEPAAGKLVAAWFGGTAEKNPDVGIWLSLHDGKAWSTPVEVANGVQPAGQPRVPTWNPVLFQPRGGPLQLYYKVGPSPTTWWGELRTSNDGGRTWGAARRLPDGIFGPIKNKPVQLADGTILSPTSDETDDKANLWRVYFERSTDGGATWTKTPFLNDGVTIGAIQPSVLFLGGDRLLALGRTRQGRVFSTISDDAGRTWGALTLTALPNPSAGTDAVTLADGRHLIVYNHTPKGRTPLNVAVSRDGLAWEPRLVLEGAPGEYSYPAVIQAADGLVHVTFTWKRQKIKHVVLDPQKL
jgi:predicted neuraminidase